MTKNNNMNFSWAPWRNLPNLSSSLWPISVKQLLRASHTEKTEVIKGIEQHFGKFARWSDYVTWRHMKEVLKREFSWEWHSATVTCLFLGSDKWSSESWSVKKLSSPSSTNSTMRFCNQFAKKLWSRLHLSWKHLCSNPSLFHVVAIVQVTTCPPGCLGVVGLCILWVTCSFHHHFVGYDAACVKKKNSDFIIKGIITGNVSNHMTIGTTDQNVELCLWVSFSWKILYTKLEVFSFASL